MNTLKQSLKTIGIVLIRAVAITLGLGLALVSSMLGGENLLAPGSFNIVIGIFTFLGLLCGIGLLWFGAWYLNGDE